MVARALSFTQARTTHSVRSREIAEELPSHLASPQVTPPPPALIATKSISKIISQQRSLKAKLLECKFQSSGPRQPRVGTVRFPTLLAAIGTEGQVSPGAQTGTNRLLAKSLSCTVSSQATCGCCHKTAWSGHAQQKQGLLQPETAVCLWARSSQRLA